MTLNLPFGHFRGLDTGNRLGQIFLWLLFGGVQCFLCFVGVGRGV